MFTILVVDDEQIHLNGLSNLLRKIRENYLVLTAKNGSEALSVMADNSVDILITDIKMPIMDGLELIEQVVDRYPVVKIVLLSGHREFEYARKALQVGVIDYLVKPINKQKIEAMILKLEDIIQKEQRVKMGEKAMLTHLDEALPIYYDHQMTKWVKGELSEKDYLDLKNNFDANGYGVVILVSFRENTEHSTKNSNTYDLKKLTQKAFESVGHSMSFYFEGDTKLFVTVINLLDEFSVEGITACAERLKTTMKEEFNLMSTIVVGTPMENFFEQIKNGFGDTLDTLRYQFYFKESVLEQKKFSRPEFPKTSFDTMVAAVSEGWKTFSTLTIRRAFDAFFHEITKGNQFPQPIELREKLLKSQMDLLDSMANNMHVENYNNVKTLLYSGVMQKEHLTTVLESLMDIDNGVIELLKKNKDMQQDQSMQKCIAFIDEHYGQELSLEQVASMIYYSPSHFSSAFKKYTGKTFSQYIGDLRLEVACDLLNNSDFKVYKIAELTGFQDTKYFYRVFKKNFLVTPDEYRRNHKLYEHD